MSKVLYKFYDMETMTQEKLNGLALERNTLAKEIERLNSIIKILDNYVIGDRMFEFGDTHEEAEQYLQELKGDGSNE